MNYWNGCGPSWCYEPNHIWGCAFPPNMLYRMMEMYEQRPQSHYNEVVVDASHFIIEAVIAGRATGSINAGTTHARLLEHFNLQSNQLPLLGWGRGGLVCVVCA